MTTAAVKLWGRTVGAVTAPGRNHPAAFEFAPEFVRSGWDVAPLTMPRQPGIFEFSDLVGETFRGLPGLLADSLPDRFGRLLIDVWLRARSRSAEQLDAVEMLCYVGNRGMGALEFEPVLGDVSRGRAVEVKHLAALAESVLENRRTLRGRSRDESSMTALREIFRAGTSAGGANPKAIIAWNESTGEIRSGEVTDEPAFAHWLIKFDRSKEEGGVPKDEGAVEFAYSRLAARAGIAMAECRLWPAGRRSHFMTKRFDRTAAGHKIHVQTLGAVAHWDFRLGGTFSYEGAFSVARRLGLSMPGLEALFRRMAFNVFASNRDDHVKNISFTMDRTGTWSLAPAYDLTYVFEGELGEMYGHQMTINSKVNGFKRSDFLACAASASVARGRVRAIIDDVREAVVGWRSVAEDAGVRQRRIEVISRRMGDVAAHYD